MDTLTKVKYTGKYGHIITEITKPQREILKDLKHCPAGQDLGTIFTGNEAITEK